MGKVLAIAWNDIKLEFSDRSTILFFLVLPLVFTTVIGVGLSSQFEDTDSRIPVLLVNEDGGELAAQLVASLTSSAVVRPIVVSADEAAGALGDSASSMVTVPAGFSAALLGGEATAVSLRRTSNDVNVLAVAQAVQAAASGVGDSVVVALASVAEAERVQPFAAAAERDAYFARGLESARLMLADPPVIVRATTAASSMPSYDSAFALTSPGQLVTWVMITLLGAAEVLVNERLGGTLRRLLVTPTRRVTVLTGKVLGRLAMGFVQMALLIGFGAYVLGVNWGRSPLALVLIVTAFALASVSLGILLAAFSRTRNQAGWLGVFCSMLMGALGGAWWPMEVTPPLYQSVVRIFPATWAMRGFMDVIVRGQGVSGIYVEVLVLLGFAVAFFSIGIARLRFE